MAPRRADAKRPVQRTGATRRADAEHAASIAARQEAERAASVAAQQRAEEEAAKHHAEFRCVAAENDARRAALAQTAPARAPPAPLDAAPKRRLPTPPPERVAECLQREAIAQKEQEDLRRRQAALRGQDLHWQEVTPNSAPAPAPPPPRPSDPAMDSFVAALNRQHRHR